MIAGDSCGCPRALVLTEEREEHGPGHVEGRDEGTGDAEHEDEVGDLLAVPTGVRIEARISSFEKNPANGKMPMSARVPMMNVQKVRSACTSAARPCRTCCSSARHG